MTGFRGMITSFYGTTGAAPGSATYDVLLYINRFVANTDSYSGWAAYGGCTYTGATIGCLYTGPGISLFPQDQVGMAVTIIGGGSFPSGQTFSAYVDGL